MLAPADKLVSQMMDDRFVTLEATDPEQAAIGMFQRTDRKALPVTDTTRVLIGVATIDDVLNVSEARATREIQQVADPRPLTST